MLAQIVALEFPLRRHFSAEQAPAESAVGDQGNPLLVAPWADILFNAAFEEVIGRLAGMQRRGRGKSLHLVGTVVADADSADFAALLKFLQGRRGLFKRDQRIGPMNLVQINDIGAQTTQGIINLLCDALGPGITKNLALLPVETDLG